MHFLKNWRQSQRYREVVAVCLPLVLGMSATTVMEFTDRVFLANYRLEAIAAATPAGISAYLFMAFFGGVGSYCGVFIAQLMGAGQPQKIGAVLWQGIYFCLGSFFILLFVSLTLSEPFFRLVGHAPAVRELEITYFNILCRGAVLHVAVQTLSAFFSGRGLTRPVMAVNFIAMAVNIPLDYALIYGCGFFPELGIAGAGIATVCSTAVAVVILLLLIFTKVHDRNFRVLRARAYEHVLFVRLLRFGIPGSMQFSLDILAFTVFILVVGRLGTVEQAATNIVLSINAIAFMPSMGVSHGVSVLVGQALGARSATRAGTATWSAIHLLLAYILVVDGLFLFAPETVLSLFVPGGGAAAYAPVQDLAADLLRIVAGYLLLDALYMVFSGVLRGAGDTRFIMISVAAASLFCLVLPLGIGIGYFDRGIYYAWGCVLLFIVSLFTLSAWRYARGAWRTMLVIDSAD